MLSALPMRSCIVIASMAASVACGSASGGSAAAVGSGPSSEAPPSEKAPDGGASSLVCKGDSRDCNGNAADGCEVDSQTDPHHCGTCGHDCLGGTCNGGHCGATRIVPFDVPDDSTYVVFATDGQDLYFSTSYRFAAFPDAAVAKVPLLGGKVSPVLRSPGHAVLSAVSLAVDDDTVGLVALGRSLWTGPKAGGEPTEIVTPHGDWQTGVNIAEYLKIAMLGGDVYFALTGRDTGVKRIPKHGGAFDPVTTDPGVASIVIDGSTLYWLTCNFAVKKKPLGGGAEETLAMFTPTGTCPEFDLVLQRDRLFFYGYQDHTIHAVSVAGGGVTTFLDAPQVVSLTGGGGGRLFWQTWDGNPQNGVRALFAAPAGDKAGASTTTIASKIVSSQSLATKTAIYWVQSDGIYGQALDPL